MKKILIIILILYSISLFSVYRDYLLLNLTDPADGAFLVYDSATRKWVDSGSGGFADVTITNSLTLSGGTANQVLYLNGSKVVSGIAGFTFDGTDGAYPGALDVVGALTSGSIASDAGVSGTTGTFTDDVTLTEAKKIYLDGGGDSYIYSPSADIVDIVTGGKIFRIAEDGNITISMDGVEFVEADVTNDDFDLKAGLNIGNFTGTADTYQTLIDLNSTAALNDGDKVGFAIKVGGNSGLSVAGLSNGTTVDEVYVEHHKGTVYTPSADQTRADDSAILVDNTIIRVVGDGGAVVLDTAPAIEDGMADGQMIIIQGTHDTNTVQIADNCNVQLAGGTAITLGKGDTIQLIWDSGDSDWYEVSRSDN